MSNGPLDISEEDGTNLRRIRTASIATLGCKLNQSESDHMARQLAEAGVVLVPFGQQADLCLVNSCTVTHIGDRKSRQLIRQALRANPESFVAVAGCYAEVEAEAVAAIEGVGAVLGNRGKDRLVEVLRGYGLALGEEPSPRLSRGEGGMEAGPSVGSGPSPHEATCTLEGAATALVSREEPPFAPTRTRAFVKIQEGCDNHCSYCIVPTARGRQRSRPAEEVLDEIGRLVREGHQEVVLTGVNITAYGRDFGSDTARESSRGAGLLRLLERILAETDVPRLRLSSLQPEDWTPAFYDLWSSGRLCRHLHLSLQSGSGAVLKRMRRRYNVDRYARIVDDARRALPGVAITTDVIVGFPGESDEEFEETERFLRTIGFAGLHVFKYSPRKGTPAASMPDQVDPRVKQQRSDRLIGLAREMAAEFCSQFVGSVLGVLWEERVPQEEARRLGLIRCGEASWWTGLSDNYVRIFARSSGDLGGTVCGARVERPATEGVIGIPLRSR
ncbi:MAG: tRNA (N(6)-L-threonylcarbamoyladenosine(37)-C(2))-methylthiotransferase MtaB [Sphingomonadaceae bacterium]